MPVGGRDITEALTRDLGVSAEEAERLKTGKGANGFDAEQLGMALGPAVDALIEEIHYALSFFWTAATDEPLGAVVLSGGPARMPGLSSQLKDRLECNVEVADPFRRLTIDGRVDRSLIEQCGPALAVAVGLATRRPGDK